MNEVNLIAQIGATVGGPGLVILCIWYFSRGGREGGGGHDVAAKINANLEKIDAKVDAVHDRVTVLEVKLDERSKMWYPSKT